MVRPDLGGPEGTPNSQASLLHRTGSALCKCYEVASIEDSAGPEQMAMVFGSQSK